MYSKKIEWEFLQDEKNLLESYSIRSNYNLRNVSSCRLLRDDEYNIILNVTAYSMDDFDRIGELVTFIFDNEISEITIKGISQNNELHYYRNKGFKTNIEFKINNVKIIYKNNLNKEVSYIKEYYLNGISDKLLFSRFTKYFDEGENLKVRESEIDKLNKTNNKMFKTHRDHLLLTLKNFSFIIQSVEDLGPEWSNNLSIEYQKDLNIPSCNIRQKNKEILSFLLGKHLIKVGESYFDKDYNIIKEISIPPQISKRTNLKNACKRREVPSIPPHDIPELHSYEKELSRVIEKYLSEEEIELSNILEHMTSSTTIPTESEIIVIGGCLDELADNWFESKKSKTSGKLIEKTEFDELMKDIFPTIKKQLKSHPDVYKNIENSYKISGYKKVKNFLDELKITQGKAEEKARGYRNLAAHGYEITDEQKIKMVYLTDVYRTFLNRIILKILNYETYFDLTTFNIMQIEDNLPDTDFKKQYKEIETFYRDIIEYYKTY